MSNHLLGRAFRSARRFVRRFSNTRMVRAATRHAHGAQNVVLGADEVMVVVMLKDAAYNLTDFIEHHMALGARHILIVDNGSTDETVKIARRYDNVSVAINTLPVSLHECALRAIPARLYAEGGWFLFLDSDEMLDPPAGMRRLSAVTQYCATQGATAVVGQMLDLYAPLPLSETATLSYQEARNVFRRYALHDVESIPYTDRGVPFAWRLRRNRLLNSAVGLKYGGIRNRCFGERCCLTKHSFVKNAPNVDLYCHPHCSSRVVVADFTLPILHYKFCGDLAARDRRQVEQGVWRHGEDRKRLDVLSKAEDITIFSPGEMTYDSPEALYDQGFLVASEQFRKHAGLRSVTPAYIKDEA